MIVSATHIKITSLFGFIRFILAVPKITRQLKTAPGLEFVKLKGFKTFTGWKDQESMKHFRNNGDHIEAMKKIKKIGKPKSVTWQAQSEPDWQEAEEKLANISF